MGLYQKKVEEYAGWIWNILGLLVRPLSYINMLHPFLISHPKQNSYFSTTSSFFFSVYFFAFISALSFHFQYSFDRLVSETSIYRLLLSLSLWFHVVLSFNHTYCCFEFFQSGFFWGCNKIFSCIQLWNSLFIRWIALYNNMGIFKTFFFIWICLLKSKIR